MVRLKVNKRKKAKQDYIISIPYGAIKRKLLKLKEVEKKYFNSLWCD